MPTISADRDRFTVAIWVACGLLILFLGGRWLLERSASGLPGTASASAGRSHSGSGNSGPRSGATPAEGVADESRGGQSTVVDVAGRVRRPGVYRLARGARVYEAIRMAGGPLRDADTTSINLAALAADGSQIIVATRGDARSSGGGAGSAQSAGKGPISLSSATVEQLDGLDGIGPALAQRIVEWRVAHGGFHSVDDLDQVSGIGPAKLEALRSQVVP